MTKKFLSAGLILVVGALVVYVVYQKQNSTVQPVIENDTPALQKEEGNTTVPDVVAMESTVVSDTVASTSPKITPGIKPEIPPVVKPKPPVSPATQPVAAPDPEEATVLQTYYEKLVKSAGVAAAFSELKKNYETSPAVKAECHQITHSIGHAAADVTGGVGKAFTFGDPMCWSGYYHGVMEETLETVGTTTLSTTIDSICADVPGKNAYSFDYYNCVHGLGHGIMLIYNYDLFVSLDVCSTLEGSWEQSSCGGGVFMENIMVESRGGTSDFLKPEDPVYPCNAVPEGHKSQCYMMQTSHILTAVGNDFTKVFEICSTVEEDYRETCYQSLGRDASGRSVSNIESTVSNCKLAPTSSALVNCVVGAVKDFISFHHSDVQAKQLCAQFEPVVERRCLDVTKDYFATF